MYSRGVLGLARAAAVARSRVALRAQMSTASPLLAKCAVALSSAEPQVGVLDSATAAVTDPSSVLINPGGFSPIYWTMDILQAANSALGTPWWATIAITTVAIRTILFPVVIKQMRSVGRLQEMQPKMLALKNRIELLTPGTPEHLVVAEQMRSLLSKYKVNPFKMFMYPILQMPIFICMFWALRRMGEGQVEGYSNGGTLWFPDLSAADATYTLPVLATLSFLAIVELGAEMPNATQGKIMKNIFRGLGVVMLFTTYSMPASVFMYWITSNTFSLAQAVVFKIPGSKAVFGIRESPPPAAPAATIEAAPAGAAPVSAAALFQRTLVEQQAQLRADTIRAAAQAAPTGRVVAPLAAAAASAKGQAATVAAAAAALPVAALPVAALNATSGAMTAEQAAALFPSAVASGGSAKAPQRPRYEPRANPRSYGRRK